MRHSSIILFSFVLWAMGQGCTFIKDRPDPPSEEVRAQLGRVRIDLVSEEAEPDISHPPSGCCEGFCRGMAHGAEVAIPKGVENSAAGPIFLFPMPVISMVFGFITMFRSLPSEEQERLEESIRNAFQENRVVPGLHARLVDRIRRCSADAILEPDEPGPADTLMRVKIDSKLLWQVPPKTRKMKEFLNPEFIVTVRARVSLIRVAGGEVLYDAFFPARSSARIFSEWSEDDGLAVRNALDAARAALAWDMAAIIFGPR